MNHKLISGLAFGDEGKGTVVDYLCSTQDVCAVVRFNGGAQAAHNVVRPDGRHHTFAQFGSGTFVPRVKTHLSRFMMVNPGNLLRENAHLVELGVVDALERLTVDEDCLITTDLHRTGNQVREQRRGVGRHGSCGLGIGETQEFALRYPQWALRAKHLADRGQTLLRLRLLRNYYKSVHGIPPMSDGWLELVGDSLVKDGAHFRVVSGDYLGELLGSGTCVFEGAQGVLLDQDKGYNPYTTWSKTTFENAETLLAEHGEQGRRIGVTRSYFTRHGPGPFVTEGPVDVGVEAHNGFGEWQGAWRTGNLDLVAVQYAVEACGGVDEVIVTHLDAPPMPVCVRYDAEGSPVLEDVVDIVEAIEIATGAPVTVESYGPTWKDKYETAHARR
jgi:adenylosuccinate synthase